MFRQDIRDRIHNIVKEDILDIKGYFKCKFRFIPLKLEKFIWIKKDYSYELV